MFFEMTSAVDINKYKNYLVFDKDTHKHRLACTFGFGLEVGHFPILDVNCVSLEMLKNFKYTHLAYTKGYDLENNISQAIDNHDLVILDKKTIDDIIEKTYNIDLPQQVANQYTNELYRNLEKDYFNEKFKELDRSMKLHVTNNTYPEACVLNDFFAYLEKIGHEKIKRLAWRTGRSLMIDKDLIIYIQITPVRQTEVKIDESELFNKIDTSHVKNSKDFITIPFDESQRKKWPLRLITFFRTDY